MSDYGIFGKGSSGNSWFANRLDDFHDSTKKYDPISHYAVEWPMKGAHGLVEKGSGALADMGVAPGFMNRLSGEANENQNNFGLGSQRMGLGILSYLGGMYAMGGEGGAAAGGGGGGLGAGDGAFLGEGVSSGIPAWDGAAGGAGLGFDAGGMNGFEPKGNMDIPGGNSLGKSGNGMGNMLGMGQQKQGQYSGGQMGGRQNLPLYQNEKSDQQKLADLLQALENQQGGY